MCIFCFGAEETATTAAQSPFRKRGLREQVRGVTTVTLSGTMGSVKFVGSWSPCKVLTSGMWLLYWEYAMEGSRWKHRNHLEDSGCEMIWWFWFGGSSVDDGWWWFTSNTLVNFEGEANKNPMGYMWGVRARGLKDKSENFFPGQLEYELVLKGTGKAQVGVGF